MKLGKTFSLIGVKMPLPLSNANTDHRGIKGISENFV